VIIDTQGKVIDANAEYVRLTGHHGLEEIRGRSVVEWTADHEKLTNEQALAQCMRDGHIRNLEIDYVDPQGKITPVEINASVVGEDDARLILTLCRDITKRKKVEAALKKSKEDAEAAAEAKSEFLNSIAHDFRTPVHVIQGFSSLLLNGQLDEKQREFLNIISHSSKGLLGLLEELVDVSRLESGRLELRSVEFDLKECVKDAFDVAKAGLLDKDVRLVYSIEDGIPAHKGDPIRLGQVLMNLMGNAVKYTDKGDIALKVWCDHERSGSEKCRIKFSIKDTGLGIPEDKLAQIFGAFTRFHEFEGGRERGGTGLGLYITKTLVDLMKGEITVASKVGVGSEFVVTIDFDMVVRS
jgi:PAS domain S-box-containing protein